MKPLIYSFLGAIIFACLCVGLFWVIGSLFGSLYDSEDVSTRNFKFFLLSLACSVVVGSITGYKLSKRN